MLNIASLPKLSTVCKNYYIINLIGCIPYDKYITW
jgi:hypothetical protein